MSTKSILFPLLLISLILIIGTTHAENCPVCVDNRIQSNETCIDWEWVEVNADGTSKEPEGAEPTLQPTTAAQATGSVGGAGVVYEQQHSADNSWWWKVLIAIVSCGFGMCCLVCVASCVALFCIRRRFIKNEFNAFDQKSRSKKKTFASEIMNATERNYTEGFSSGDDSAYEYDNELAPDTVPRDSFTGENEASRPLMAGGDDNSLFESDEYQE